MTTGYIISLIQHFEADFLWKVSFKILNSGLILKTFTQADYMHSPTKQLEDLEFLFHSLVQYRPQLLMGCSFHWWNFNPETNEFKLTAIRPNKKISVFQEMGLKNLGRIG